MEQQYELQKSPEWYRKRYGRFTSSMAYVFIPQSKTEGEPNAAAKTYIMGLLWELLTGEHKEIKAQSLTWGNDYEPYAKLAVQERYMSKFYDCGLIIDTNYPYRAGSPDGSIDINGMEYTVENKCPVGVEHLVNIKLFKSLEAVKKSYPELYWQCMQNMYLMNTKVALAASFHHQAGELSYADIHIPYNEVDMKLLIERQSEAWQWMQQQAKIFGIDILAKYAEYAQPTQNQGTPLMTPSQEAEHFGTAA